MTGYVYLMGVLDGCHKIGRSDDPHGRRNAVGVNLPAKIEVVHVIASRDSIWLEAVLHIAYRPSRQCGEWFRLTADDLRLLASVRSASSFHDLPQPLLALYATNFVTQSGPARPAADARSPDRPKEAILSGESEDRRDIVHGLAAKLVAARTTSGLSQTAAAAAAKVSRPNLSRYEAGTKTPTVAVLMKLAVAYGVGVSDLLPTPEPVAPPVPAPRPRPMGKFK